MEFDEQPKPFTLVGKTRAESGTAEIVPQYFKKEVQKDERNFTTCNKAKILLW